MQSTSVTTLDAGQLIDRRARLAWYAYDWGNSAFPLIVVAVFLGPYLTSIARDAADINGFVNPLGTPVLAGSLFPYAVSASAFLQIICLPILGALADYSRRKKWWLAITATSGALATLGLYWVEGTNYVLGAGLFVVANVAFGASSALYNAFLLDVASPEERTAVSSIGWAFGYVGGGLLLAANLALVSQASALGITTAHAVRIGLASAGVWWAIFSLVPLLGLKTHRPARALPRGEQYLVMGFRQLRGTLAGARGNRDMLLFLGAYLLFNNGIQTVVALAAELGQEELGLPVSTLTAVILMVQFVAALGTIVFKYLADLVGLKIAISGNLVAWIIVLVSSYMFLRTVQDFWILGGAIGVVLGGSRALSRAAYSLMIPEGEESEYFSLYEVGDHGTTWAGPLVFGLVLQFNGGYRVAILALVAFFILGLALLSRVNLRAAARGSGNIAPRLA